MLTGHEAEQASGTARPWADLLERHRSEWVASLSGERSVMWVDDYTRDAGGEHETDALRSAVAEGRPVVIGLRADARGAAAREASRLATELGGVTLCQRLAAGSLIGPDEGDEGDAVHFLVCVNLDRASAAASNAEINAEPVPLMTGYVRYLEEANRSLTEANVRLARERLGVHDSAAAAIAGELKEHRETAQKNYEAMLNARAELRAPRYRAVDKLRDLVFQVPGLSALLRLRSRMLSERGPQR
jgi:hypothetical protein